MARQVIARLRRALRVILEDASDGLSGVMHELLGAIAQAATNPALVPLDYLAGSGVIAAAKFRQHFYEGIAKRSLAAMVQYDFSGAASVIARASLQTFSNCGRVYLHFSAPSSSPRVAPKRRRAKS